jgi:hypothetical protein
MGSMRQRTNLRNGTKVFANASLPKRVGNEAQKGVEASHKSGGIGLR